MVDTPALTPDELDLAARLALGLPAGEERAAALRQILANPAIAHEVSEWHRRLAPLLDEVAEADPPARVWPAIERRLSPPAVDPAEPRALARWRGGALVAAGLAASLALFLAIRPQPVAVPGVVPPADMAVAQMASADKDAVFSVRYDPSAGLLKARGTVALQPGQAPELWVIPADGVPRSLGLIDPQAKGHPVAPQLRGYLVDGATLAITIENAADAPHTAPGSTPIVTGTISVI